jgi:hypothetical protein
MANQVVNRCNLCLPKARQAFRIPFYMNRYHLPSVFSLSLYTVLCCFNSVQAQITGGQHIMEHLSIPHAARITALGGAAIAVKDADLNLALYHPAALNAAMNGKITFQHQFYLADLQNGAFGYARHLNKLNTTVHTGIQYMDYGKIAEADEFGTKTGQDIAAGEWAWTIGAARAFTPKISLGMNLRVAGAQFAEFRSTALMADASAMYADTARRVTYAILLKNRGAQLSRFQGTREALPYDLQFGFSKRLRYLPFRLGIIVHHLHQWNIRYNDPNAVDDSINFLGQQQDEKQGNPQIDNFFRHFIFNGEFILGKNENFFIRFGYNHLRKRELSVTNLRSLAGFSGGIGMKIKRFTIDLGLSSYHLAGGGFHLGFGTDLDTFRK